MQQNLKSTPSHKHATTGPATAPSVKTGLLELDIALLKHVAGGSQNGTWVEATPIVAAMPKGTW